MKRGFVFMLDAFIALLLTIAFVSSLNQFSRDYSYIQDETLYSYGRGLMNILLTHEVNVTVSETEPKAYQMIPLVHALTTKEGKDEMDKIDKLIPPQYDYVIEYYNSTSSNWLTLYYPPREKMDVHKSIAVISTVPVIYSNENYTAPYTYGEYCGDLNNPINRCLNPEDLYHPDEFGSYDNAYVRVVIKI